MLFVMNNLCPYGGYCHDNDALKFGKNFNLSELEGAEENGRERNKTLRCVSSFNLLETFQSNSIVVSKR